MRVCREQRTENREQRTENREQKIENRKQRTENRKQRTENREQRTENREQRNMFLFENLTVYKKSLITVNSVYSFTKRWPKDERYCLVDQSRRAVTSIALNIAEGNSRTKKDFRHFLDIARGSCFETIAILAIAKQQKYLSDTEYSQIYDQLEELTKMIQGLQRSLR